MNVEKRQLIKFSEASKPKPPPKPKLNFLPKKKKSPSGTSLATILQGSLADTNSTKGRAKSKSMEDKSTKSEEIFIADNIKSTSTSNLSARRYSDATGLLLPYSDPLPGQETILPNIDDHDVALSPDSILKQAASLKRSRSNSSPHTPLKEQVTITEQLVLHLPLVEEDTGKESEQEPKPVHSYEDMYQVFHGTPAPRESVMETAFPYYEEIPAELKLQANLTTIIIPKDDDGYVSLNYRHDSKGEGSTSSATTDDPPSQPMLETTTPELSLKEVTTLQTLQLPQLAKVTKGHTCPINGSVNPGDLLLLVSNNKVAAVKGICTESKEPVYLLQNSNHTLSPISEEATSNVLLTVDQLLASRRLPPVAKVVEPLTQTKGNTIPEGTLLFFDKDAKQQSLLLRKNYVKAKTSMGEAVMITQASKGTFNINYEDITISLPEAINHIQFPSKFRLLSKPKPVTVTLLSVCQENVLAAQPFDLAKGLPTPQYIQLPVCWDVTLQMVEVAGDKEHPHRIKHYCSFRLSSTNSNSVDESFEENVGYDRADSWLPGRADKVLQKQTYKPPRPPTPPPYKPREPSVLSPIHDANISYLKTLQTTEIVQLLEGLKIQQYQTAFESESVDGELLSSLCEQDLLEEFHITKRIDRIRVLKLIDGSYSAKEILSNMYI